MNTSNQTMDELKCDNLLSSKARDGVVYIYKHKMLVSILTTMDVRVSVMMKKDNHRQHGMYIKTNLYLCELVEKAIKFLHTHKKSRPPSSIQLSWPTTTTMAPITPTHNILQKCAHSIPIDVVLRKKINFVFALFALAVVFFPFWEIK
jgi:hypothetical protein